MFFIYNAPPMSSFVRTRHLLLVNTNNIITPQSSPSIRITPSNVTKNTPFSLRDILPSPQQAASLVCEQCWIVRDYLFLRLRSKKE